MAEAAVETLVQLVETLEWDARDISEAIRAFFRSEKDHVAKILADEDMDPSHLKPSVATIAAILVKRRIAGDGTAKVIVYWLQNCYEDEFEQQISAAREPFVAHCRVQFGHTKAAADPQKMADYAGDYRLIRPFHLDPLNYFAVERLRIGGSESAFACELICRYDYNNFVGEVHSHGRAVPHGPKLFMLMCVGEDRDSNLMLFFDRRERPTMAGSGNGNGKQFRALWGIMIASVGVYDAASAWPCYAIRLEPGEEFTPHILPAAEAKDLPDRAKLSLARGAVYWHDSHYPDTFLTMGG